MLHLSCLKPIDPFIISNSLRNQCSDRFRLAISIIAASTKPHCAKDRKIHRNACTWNIGNDNRRSGTAPTDPALIHCCSLLIVRGWGCRRGFVGLILGNMLPLSSTFSNNSFLRDTISPISKWNDGVCVQECRLKKRNIAQNSWISAPKFQLETHRKVLTCCNIFKIFTNSQSKTSHKL